jgi:hypothetical protein
MRIIAIVPIESERCCCLCGNDIRLKACFGAVLLRRAVVAFCLAVGGIRSSMAGVLDVERYDPPIHVVYFCPQLYKHDPDKMLVPLQGEEIGKLIAQALRME